jgi:hypothetical protein
MRRLKRHALRDLSIAIGIMLVPGSYCVWLLFTDTSEWSATAADAPIDSLPADATDIHYYHGHFNGTESHHFRTTEAQFHQWAVTSHRAGQLAGPTTFRGRISAHNSLIDQPAYATIIDGVGYTWSFEDQGITYAYDRDTGRAYYYAHSR